MVRSLKNNFDCNWRRSGIATIESMIILLGMLFLLFSFIDTCLAVYRHNTLNVIAKDICRYASMRGANFTIDESEVIGPTEIDGVVEELDHLPEVIRQRNGMFNLEDIRVVITWPDGDNQPGNAVRVEIEYPTSTMLPTSDVLFPEFLKSSSQATIQ